MLYVWGDSYEFDNDQNWDLIENFSASLSEIEMKFGMQRI